MMMQREDKTDLKVPVYRRIHHSQI